MFAETLIQYIEKHPRVGIKIISTGDERSIIKLIPPFQIHAPLEIESNHKQIHKKTMNRRERRNIQRQKKGKK